MIAIVDYGAGNLRSIKRALESHGVEATITGDPTAIGAADRVVLPGVGNAKAAMDQLHATGIADAVVEQAEKGTPLLGVCLGMQLLFGEQEEGPTTGLGILPGTVTLLPPDHKIPHMGWNTVEFKSTSPMAGADPAAFYFVHSYEVKPESTDVVAGVTEYGHRFASIVIRDNVWGTQFHPEKSQHAGLHLLGTWLKS